MCGIAGILAPNVQADVLTGILDRMVSSLRHRGPDDTGSHAVDGVAIGMSRLSIIDVAGGHQPISNEDGSVTIVCNGEIYNHAEIRPRLLQAGHVFRTASDVEVILHLYEDHDTDCLRDVQGMFGVAIWDSRRRRLLLARDRLGIKPLYYAYVDGRLLFGSELKAIASAGMIDLHLDPVAMDLFFTLGYVPAPYAIYKEVRKLKPGHLLTLEDGRLTQEPYWTLQFEPDLRMDEEQATERFRQMFKEVVRSHLMSEVPLGAFLSGGVDSGLVVALMSEMTSTPVRTFTIGFSAGAGGYLDERGYARAISSRYGTAHTEFEVEPRLDEVLAPIVESFDEPIADDSVIPTYYISQLAKRSVTVALSGLGGDELFAGYERHLGLGLSLKFDRVPRWLLSNVLAPAVGWLPERRDGHYTVNHVKRFARAAALSPWDRYMSYVTVTSKSLKTQLYTPDAAQALAESLPVNGAGLLGGPVKPPKGSTWVTEALRFDTAFYLPDDLLALTDRLSMAHGLELRVPFVDHRLVEFCATIPEDLKLRGVTKKYLLKRVAAQYLPDDVVNHRKQGFASPMAWWMRNDLNGYLREILAGDRIAKYGLLQPSAVRGLLDRHASRQESHDKQLFAILMFQRWCERYL